VAKVGWVATPRMKVLFQCRLRSVVGLLIESDALTSETKAYYGETKFTYLILSQI